MIRLLLAFVSWFAAFFRSRHDLGLELIALRQQVSVLKRKNPRPKLTLGDRLFWLGLRRWWSQWASVLVVVKPETVVRWHRAGFGWYCATASADRESPSSFATSSGPWRRRIRPGALRGSTVSC